MGNYTVYKHTSPSGKVYIGITSKNPVKRWNGGSGYLTNDYFTKAINKYGWNNFIHEILFSGLTKEEAEEKEIELISRYRSDERERGYNIQHGGNSIGKHSEETKRKIGLANKGRKPWTAGNHHSEETRKKLADFHRGRSLSEETKRKISEAHRGRKQSEEYVRKRAEANGKHVICTENGMEFSSIKSAAQYANVVPSAVNACLKHRTNSAGGFHWEYA